MKESPTLEDYLATGALSNVPLWIYLLLLTFDASGHTLSSPILFYTIIPVVAMLTGGFVASFLMCRRIKSHSFRNGLLFGVAATVVNLIFGVATLAPSTPFVAAICFLASAVLAVILWRRKDTVHER